MGRFINADAYASTGTGLLGYHMFAYCNSNPVMYSDTTGFALVPCTVAIDDGGGKLLDYVIYYSNDQSSSNLEDPAKQNHSAADAHFVGVGSFDEFVAALDCIPRYVNDVYIYMHGDADSLSFYYAQYYFADDIEDAVDPISVFGDVYLFSCQGGRGELASSLANSTNCTVVASVYKVSFDRGSARCGWKSYMLDVLDYGAYSWYSFYPDGSKSPVSFFWILTK